RSTEVIRDATEAVRQLLIGELTVSAALGVADVRLVLGTVRGAGDQAGEAIHVAGAAPRANLHRERDLGRRSGPKIDDAARCIAVERRGRAAYDLHSAHGLEVEI